MFQVLRLRILTFLVTWNSLLSLVIEYKFITSTWVPTLSTSTTSAFIQHTLLNANSSEHISQSQECTEDVDKDTLPFRILRWWFLRLIHVVRDSFHFRWKSGNCSIHMTLFYNRTTNKKFMKFWKRVIITNSVYSPGMEYCLKVNLWQCI